MRSEGNEAVVDCDDPMTVIACTTDTDACPAACKEDNNKDPEDIIVKSGDLAVTAKAAEGKKALIGGTSDLDTLTFKTSEEVSISKITLERYGYSTIADVENVWLEDEDGNIIADPKPLNSKGQVNLSLKKDYKTVDGTFRATVVVKTNNLNGNNGSTLGFKVVAAESTAKNLNLDDYSPYTYDLVNYAGSAVEFTSRNSATKDYNFEAGEFYEVSKFRVKAPSDAAILVKGFTLNDDATTEENNETVGVIEKKIDARRYIDDVKVTVDGEAVDGLKWNINKNNELVISFDDVELAAKQNSTFVVNASFNEDFDQFGYSIQYNIASIEKFSALDKKTESRITESTEKGKRLADVVWTTYTFNGGKIKLSGTKLGTVDAARNATNVKVAEGNITITEALRGTVKLTVTQQNYVDEMRLVINGDEFDGTPSKNNDVWTFNGVEIEKSGKVEVRIDMKELTDADEGTVMEFTSSFNSDSFTELLYDDSGKPQARNEVTGSIPLSKVKIQAAKASIENKLTKEVEFIVGETNRKTIFDGTYTSKKGYVELTSFAVQKVAGDLDSFAEKATLYLTVDGEEYDLTIAKDAALATPSGEESDDTTTSSVFSDDINHVKVAEGKTVNVKLELELTPAEAEKDKTVTFNLELAGEDEDSNPAGNADEDTIKVKFVEEGTLNVNSSAKNTVLLKSDRSLAEFTIKPSKSDEDMTLETLKLSTTPDKVELKVVVDGETQKATDGVYKPGIRVPAEGVVVKVSLKSEYEDGGEVLLTVEDVNASHPNTKFRKNYQPAILKITQEKKGDITKYNVDVEKDDSSTVVSNVKFYAGANCTKALVESKTLDTTKCTLVANTALDDPLSDTDNSMQATNDEAAKSVTVIAYDVKVSTANAATTVIDKAVYDDFFKVNGGDYLMVFSNK